MYEHSEIILRKLEAANLVSVTELKRESWLFTHRVSIVNWDDQERWWKCLSGEDVHTPKNLVLTASQENTTFGIYKILNVDYINRTADVGWDVYEKNRGKGLGKKLVTAGAAFCFDILNLRRLDAEILANNGASLKCAQNAGFSKEGVRRQAVHKLGEYVDSVVLGLLSSERKF
jgi:RimJ/RimL family protein N-acetyltransferase